MEWGGIVKRAEREGVTPEVLVLRIFSQTGSVNKTAQILGAARKNVARYLKRSGLDWNGKQWVEVETNNE